MLCVHACISGVGSVSSRATLPTQCSVLQMSIQAEGSKTNPEAITDDMKEEDKNANQADPMLDRKGH